MNDTIKRVVLSRNKMKDGKSTPKKATKLSAHEVELARLVSEKAKVTIRFQDGTNLRACRVLSFDKFSLVVEEICDDKELSPLYEHPQIIFKHGIRSIRQVKVADSE